MFTDIKEVLEKEFYEIFNVEGIKMIKFYGYISKSKEAGIDWFGNKDSKRKFRILELMNCIMPLDIFLQKEKVCPGAASRCITDAYEDEALNLANHWFKRGKVRKLPLYKLEKNTPCGFYINFE